jgi:integrase
MSKQRNPNGTGSYSERKDGRKRWRKSIDGKTKDISAKDMASLKAKVKFYDDHPFESSTIKTGEWFDRWLEIYVQPLKKAATYDQYSIIYKKHIKPEIGSKNIAKITSMDIQGVIAKMSSRGLSTKTMIHAKNIMKRGFDRAVKDKIILECPVKDIEIPKKQAKPRKTLMPEETEKLLQAMSESRWIWSVKFLLVTGIRRGELLALKWSDIDRENKRLTIDESNSSTGLGDTKSSKVHYVPLSKKAFEYLDGQEEMLKAEFNKITIEKQFKKSDKLVFPNESGGLIRPDSYYKMIARFSKKAGVKASPHCFRHTFVYMTREHLSLKELQSILGHDESTTTLDIYGDILNDTTEKTVSTLDSVFDNIKFEAGKPEVDDSNVIDFQARKKAK